MAAADELKPKLEVAVHESLSTMVRSLVSIGVAPMDALELIERQFKTIARQVEAAVERGVTP